MNRMLAWLTACALVLAPAAAHADKKPKPPDGPKVPYGLCSVVDIVANSDKNPCPDD